MSQPQPQPQPRQEPPKRVLVKARVKANSTYSTGRTHFTDPGTGKEVPGERIVHVAGEIVEVEPKELKRVPHCLISLEEEEANAKKAVEAKKGDDAFHQIRAASIAAGEQARVAANRLAEIAKTGMKVL